MNWWGPVSIRYIFTIVICFDNVGAYILGFFQIQFCPRVKGACVYKYFSPSNPIYKPALCFDGVGIIFSYFLETNLVGARVYIVHFYHPLYALILIYKLWGPVSISISHHLYLYTNLHYALMVWGSYFHIF